VIELIDFDKDEAAQDLLGFAGIREPYEELISRASLHILRKSVPACEIRSIRYVVPAGRHPKFQVGGMPLEEDSRKITLQDMTMPFDIEIIVCAGDQTHCLTATFTIECREMDQTPKIKYLLDVHKQTLVERQYR
jgi:hypothetical protein